MGIFTAFLGDENVKLVGVEPAGEGIDKPGKHAATLSVGKPGEIHGMKCYVLENADGTPAAVHSIASGLDYPGVGPQHSYLKDIGRVDYQSVDDKECLNAFMTLSRVEGIIPALESAHAVAWAMREAPGLGKDQHILVNLSGRGDKDADYVARTVTAAPRTRLPPRQPCASERDMLRGHGHTTVINNRKHEAISIHA